MKGYSHFKEEQLIQHLSKLLEHADFNTHKNRIEELATKLNLSPLDYAAALSLLNATQLRFLKPPFSTHLPKPKTIRYRLNVGYKHDVSAEDIKSTLIEITGVEEKRISWLDIRDIYSLVDLPDGMSADIFQLLAETEIKNQRLNLKRVKYQKRFYRRNYRSA